MLREGRRPSPWGAVVVAQRALRRVVPEQRLLGFVLAVAVLSAILVLCPRRRRAASHGLFRPDAQRPGVVRIVRALPMGVR